MKYLSKKFSSPANSKDFVDNWDAIFKKDEPVKTETTEETKQSK